MEDRKIDNIIKTLIYDEITKDIYYFDCKREMKNSFFSDSL